MKIKGYAVKLKEISKMRSRTERYNNLDYPGTPPAGVLNHLAAWRLCAASIDVVSILPNKLAGLRLPLAIRSRVLRHELQKLCMHFSYKLGHGWSEVMVFGGIGEHIVQAKSIEASNRARGDS